jgi:hypothetical protein
MKINEEHRRDEKVFAAGMLNDNRSTKRLGRHASLIDVVHFWTSFFCVDELSSEHCWICECEQAAGQLHRAHIIPYRRGGSAGPWNLVLTCAKCNDKAESSVESVYAIVRHVSSMKHVADVLNRAFDPAWCPFDPREESSLQAGLVACTLRRNLAAVARSSHPAISMDGGGRARLAELMACCKAAVMWMEETGREGRAQVAEWLVKRCIDLGVYGTEVWAKAVRSFYWESDEGVVYGERKSAEFLSAWQAFNWSRHVDIAQVRKELGI